MKRFLLSVILIFLAIQGFAQKDSTKTDTTLVRTSQSLADDRAKKLLPQYAPLSPTAAAQQKFGDYQVNLATGIPSIPIQIYTIKEGSLSVPISLSFHTGGTKINEQASWVGLGVALDIGASLNRNVQGLKDDNDGGSYLTHPVTVSRDFCNTTADFNYGQSVVLNQTDTQPDIFSYNLSSGSSSKSGRFLLGQNGGSHFRIPDYPIQITYAGSPAITTFDLVNDDGVAYRFGGNTSAVESQTVISGFTTQNYISSWLISQVKSPDSDDLIYYIYQSGGSQYLTEKQWVSSMILNAVPQSGGYYTNSQNSLPTFTNSSTTISQANPHKITFTNGEVEFVQSAVGERLDLPNSHFLKQINIYNYENGSKNLIKVVKFTYSYFTHNGANKRLKLDKVSFEDALGIVTEPYIPEYWSNTLSWDDELDNEKKDFFGYYNGKPNTHLIPVSSYQGIPIVGGAADRSSVDTYMKEGVIKRLNFPSGGYTEFDFETNKYNDGTSDLFAGGLRVKSIKSVTGSSSFLKRYVYESSAGIGIGRLTTNWSPASASVPSLQVLSYSNSNGTSVAQATQASFTQSGGALDLNTFDTAPVYYTKVTEYFEDASDPIKNGKNVYNFDFRQDLIVNAFNFSSRDVQPWKRGNLLSKSVYDAAGNILESQSNSYQELNINTRTAGAFVKTPNIFEGSIVRSTIPCPTTFLQNAIGFSGNFPEMVYASVNYHTGINLLSGSSTTTDNVNVNKTITYNNKLLIAQTQSDDSKTGDNLTEIFKYPFDPSLASDPIAQQLLARNQLNPILENEIQETVSGVTNTIYNEKKVYNSFTGNNSRGLTNNILPAEIWVAPMGLISEKRVEFKNYDAFGNLLTYEVDGQPTTLVWGYNNSLVSCIAKNATLSQVNAALSSAGLSPSGFSVSSLSTGQENILQNFRNTLPNTLIDWYLYKSHIGLSQSFAPNALKTNYFYDSHQRFSKATDHEGNILQTNFYKISPTENYIVSTKPRIATTNDISANLYFNSLVDYQYFDGLGRPTQAIEIGQTPDQKSIIKSEIYYDKFNRQLSSLLPVSAGVLTYAPIANAKSLAQTFYADAAPTDSTIFEFSPLNRPKVNFGVGNAWRIADKKTQIFYESGGTEVRNYSVNSSGNIVLSGTYPANSLFKKRVLDEQGHESIEYSDKRGRMIEKRQQLETGVYAHTHYIYDGLGRPKAIIQPMGYELNTGFTYNSTDFQNWVFFNNYDFRGRNDLKHVPAAGFTKMIYDKKDRLVMQQDALQATLNKWNFQKYDSFSREVFRGETVNSNSQPVLQSAFNTHAVPDEVWSSGGGYNGGSFPTIANPSGNDVQHYTFYDQYDFVAALNTNFNFDAGNSYHTKHSSAKGLQTGSVSYNLADHNQYFMSASYFDTKNRPIQTFETHILSPTLPNRTDVEYNFAGDVVKQRILHKKVASPELTELYENEYDHVGRPMKIFHTLNSLKTEIVRFSYDPIGRQILKKIKPGFTYKSGLSDIIIRSSEPPLNTQDYVRRNIQLLPGFVYCPDSLAPSLYLGQVDTLGLGGTADALQTIDYSYNIRNGLRCINCTNDLMNNLNQTQNDLFGMKLDFHESGLRYDGNIHKQTWLKANDNVQRSYTYNYDFSKRLKSATFQSANNEDFSLPSMSYDKNGNILSLARKGKIGSNFNLLDDLSYSYLGNKLLKVEDAVSDTTKNYFNNRNISTNDFEYDANGNLIKDLNENISQINYTTYLNQPVEVIKSNGSWDKSLYDGSGHLFKRTNSKGTTWTYSGNIIYKNDTLYQISTPEGRIIQDTLSNYHYQFEYRDLTGNLRLLYQDPTFGNPATRMAPEIVQSQDYEPFGVGFNEYFGSRNNNRFGYSNHEIINDLGLNRIDFGNRTYNPTYGRFDKSDIMIEKFNSLTNYNFTLNNPNNIIDPDGNEARDIWGNTTFQGFVGDDGSGNFVGTTTGGGEGDDKGKKKEEEKKTSREKALEVKGKGFWEFMNFAFSTDGLSFLIDEIYKIEGSGNLAENAHPVEKVNELATIYATGKLFVTIGKGSNAFKKSIEIPKGFRETGQFRKVGAAKAPILTNGKVFISPDLTQHKTEGWKMAKTIDGLKDNTTRIGTYDKNLKKISK